VTSKIIGLFTRGLEHKAPIELLYASLKHPPPQHQRQAERDRTGTAK